MVIHFVYFTCIMCDKFQYVGNILGTNRISSHFKVVHIPCTVFNSYCCPVCRKIAEDSEYGLFSVTLFRKVADEFKQNARDKK